MENITLNIIGDITLNIMEEQHEILWRGNIKYYGDITLNIMEI